MKFYLAVQLLLCLIALYANAAEALPTDTFTTNEIIITAPRIVSGTQVLSQTLTVIPSSQIERSQQQALLPLLAQQVPGLFTTSRGLMGYGVATGAAGNMTVRGIGGSPTTGLLVVIDGHPQYMGLMGHPLADAYQSMMAEQVEIVRGAASALYGSNAMGGVINIVTKKQHEDGAQTGLKVGGGSYNTIITESSNMFKEGAFNSVVTAQYQRTDGHRHDIGFEQYGGYAKVGYDISPAWNISGDVNLTHFNASNPGTIDAPILDNDSRVTRGVASLGLDSKYESTAGSLKLYYNWGQHRINNGYTAPAEPLDYRFHSNDVMLGVSAWQSFWRATNDAARFTIGADYAHYGGRAYNYFLGDGHEVQLADEVQSDAAVYVSANHPLTAHITGSAALRAHHYVRKIEWIPQAGIAAELPFNATLKLMASKGFRNPTIRELYMFDVANPSLQPERLWNYELSLAHSALAGRLLCGLNLFYIKGDNMIQTQPVGGRLQNVNVGKVENHGVEAEASYRVNDEWSVAANYSWLDMKYPVLAAPEHKFYANVDFVKSDFKVGASLQYIAGLYTALPSAVTSTKREEFILLNFMGSYKLTKLFEVYIRGENLLGQAYTINYGYPMPGATVFGGFNLVISF